MTKIVNLFAGPCSGKSGCSAMIFAEMKRRHISCEIASEAIKDFIWQDHGHAIKCQPYIFGCQLLKIESLLNKVEYIICDSPLLFSCIYGKEHPDFKNFVYRVFMRYNNINLLLQRSDTFQEAGRIHSLEESIEVDKEILKWLEWTESNYYTLKTTDFNPKNIENIVDKILNVKN